MSIVLCYINSLGVLPSSWTLCGWAICDHISTQYTNTLSKICRGHNIALSDAARVSVIVEFTDRHYSGMVGEVLFVMPLSHLLCIAPSSTCCSYSFPIRCMNVYALALQHP